MAVKITPAFVVARAALDKSTLDGGVLALFSGPLPASANDAITESNTKLATYTKDGDGSTGLTFDTPTTGTLLKSASETWKCGGSGVTTGQPTFYRWLMDGDDGASDGGTATIRLQGTVGTDPNAYDLVLSSPNLTNGTDSTIDSFSVYEPSST